MRDLHALRVFLAVAHHRSFARAARQMGTTAASVTRAVAGLEAELGIQLFIRTTRQVSLTAEGAALTARVAPLVDGLDRTLDQVRAGPASERGTLSISVPVSFGTRILPPILSEFRTLYPGIALKCDMTDTMVDLVGGGIDMAVRITQTVTARSTIVRKIMLIERHLVAAPESPEALANDPDCLDPARCLGHCEPGRIEGWTLERDGQTRRISAGHELSANNGDLLAHLAADGHGVALLPDFQVRRGLASGRLVRVLPDWSVTPVWLSLAYPPYSRLPAPVALFSDFVEARLPAATRG